MSQSPRRDLLGRKTAIDHVGVVVRDLRSAIDYFTKLGLELVSEEEIVDAGVHVAYLGNDGQLLQLLQPVRNGPLQAYLEEHGEGLHHVCFAVPAIRELIESLPGEEEPAINRGGRGTWTCFLRQRHHGVVVELAEARQPE